MGDVVNKAKHRQIAIIVSRFNEMITRLLLEGCLDELKKGGIKEADIKVVWVTGAFEIPLIALKLARRKNIDAVICLGAIIRGETFHFELVARQTASGIQQAAIATGIPIIFGVLAVDTLEQAYKRSEGSNHRGRESARSALEMIQTLRDL